MRRQVVELHTSGCLMTLAVPLALLVLFWSGIYLLNHFYIQNHINWRETLSRNGFSISPGALWWESKSLNPFFEKTGHIHRHFLSRWFTIGSHFGLLSCLCSFLFLVWNLLKMFISRNDATPSATMLTPIIPGVNLPFSQIFYFFGSLMLSGIIHEAGHALAAVVEKVEVKSFGMFLFLAYPGAFVQLKDDEDDDAGDVVTRGRRQPPSVVQQIKIVCAGAWHNAVLALLAYILWSCLPLFLSLAYYRVPHGLIITQLTPGTPFSNHLRVGDIVHSISEYPLIGKKSYRESVGYLMSDSYSSSYMCLPHSIITRYGNFSDDCCEHPRPGAQCFVVDGVQHQRLCGSAKTFLENTKEYCCPSSDLPCIQRHALCSDKSELIAVQPVLDKEDGVFMKISTDRGSFPFQGNPLSLWREVSMEELAPRWFNLLGSSLPLVRNYPISPPH
ncbi:membrane-bound transcription factor peptidase, site 2, partial [Planoprotostelium fungivorum]